MSICIVTGAAGLIGAESVRYFHQLGFDVVGIDNGMRQYFFGAEASTNWSLKALLAECPRFTNVNIDIRDVEGIQKLFRQYSKDIALIIHTAAQPSHDWAAREPLTDFSINATGTLNLLEATRQHCPDAVFIFTSTNKVYGDTPNRLPLQELATRWEIDPAHAYHAHGIDESMSIDQTKHSLFGASKVAADVLAQEYGRYFGMKTGIFRGGCLTGPGHSGSEMHGFLAYMMKCAATGKEYRVIGYKGKQVRDNIHSSDLVAAFHEYFKNPRQGEVYNVGGGRFSNCSVIEAIAQCEAITGRKMQAPLVDENRIGDHIWWMSDTRKLEAHLPDWKLTRGIDQILREIHDYNQERWGGASQRAGT